MAVKIRDIAAWSLSLLIIILGFTRRVKKKALNGEFILSIYFHSPSKKLFEFCIKWLIRNKFTILSQQEVLEITRNNIAFPKGGVIVTLDDGWESNEENVVSVAEKYKVPITIFLPTDAIEEGVYWWSYAEVAHAMEPGMDSVSALKKVANEYRESTLDEIKRKVTIDRQALSLEQVKHIADSDNITIGSHTVSHPILINCQDEKSYFELSKSKDILEKWVNKEVYSFAYPNGDYSAREIRYLRELGYKIAYTTVPAYLTKDALKNVYELPRFEVFEGVTKAEAICRMLGIWQNLVKK